MILITLLAEEKSSFLQVFLQKRIPRRDLKESNDLSFKEVLLTKNTSTKKRKN